MKTLLLMITFFGLISISHADVKSSEILRARINIAHLNPADYRGGVIDLLPGSIKLVMFVEAVPSKIKEVIVEAPITNIDVTECGLVMYEASNENISLTLEDRAFADCGQAYNYKVALQYTTVEDGNEFTSRFDGSDFSAIDFNDFYVPIGQQNEFHSGPSILPVIPTM